MKFYDGLDCVFPNLLPSHFCFHTETQLFFTVWSTEKMWTVLCADQNPSGPLSFILGTAFERIYRQTRVRQGRANVLGWEGYIMGN